MGTAHGNQQSVTIPVGFPYRPAFSIHVIHLDPTAAARALDASAGEAT